MNTCYLQKFINTYQQTNNHRLVYSNLFYIPLPLHLPLHGFEGGRSGMVGWSLPVWPSAWGEASKAWTIQCLSEPHLSRGAHPGICDVFVAAASKQPIWGSLMEIRGRALMTAIGGPFLAKLKIKRKNTQKIPRRRKPQLSSPTG